MSHKDQATREALASELGELKSKYSQLEKAYTELRNQTFQPQMKIEDTVYREASIAALSELGHS
ncbi:hypothetical protein [Desulfosporosinus meridiei]|uniref:Uncharacterized protein n=1 Tax=Desulfosporosinus meridiei (strain ATCC BAA-275 / DSM 13257 / KCTC 12902 / NCIMB 13706 / S10) TaxID=768704 RepID=J7IRE9_DESMD|nr:hypothetical protein [Desulfosporosinus meridiei]AFQ42759.1 hypothetical protein Desmer_0727 [Desulfosporosinus meridiei DSM 13257]